MSECASRQHASPSVLANCRFPRTGGKLLVRSGMRRRHQKKALPTKTPVDEDEEDVIFVRTLDRSSLKSESPNLPVPARKKNGAHLIVMHEC